MRAVSLSDKTVQTKVAKSFVPLKVKIDFGTEKFPLDWPGLANWKATYQQMGGKAVTGITACCVISPDLQTQYASTGSAMVWELFDSIAYDAEKFAAMLDRARVRFEGERKIRNDRTLTEKERETKLANYRAELRAALGKEGTFQFPPRGFTVEGAKELFRLSGDLKDGESEKDKPAKKPLGTWKKSDGKMTILIAVTEKGTGVKIESEKLNLDFEADYSLSRGNSLYASIRKVKDGDDKMTGELLGFDYEVKEGELVLSKFKGTGAIALGGFFMNGTYKKKESKKE